MESGHKLDLSHEVVRKSERVDKGKIYYNYKNPLERRTSLGTPHNFGWSNMETVFSLSR